MNASPTHTIELPARGITLDRPRIAAAELVAIEAGMRSGAVRDGYLQVDRPDLTELLLIYRGVVHSAVRLVGDLPQTQPLGQLFTGLTRDGARRGRFCETDTGLLLLIAVFSQARPTIRVPTRVVNFIKLFEELRRQAQSCVMVLSREGELSFVFCKGGVPVAAYFARTASVSGRNPTEQITQYCHQLDAAPTILSVYHDLRTARDENAHRSFADLLAGKTGPAPFLLHIRHPNHRTLSRVIQTGRCSIGRDPGNDVVIDHRSVSRNHCLLEWRGSLEVSDTGSVNGTFVDGKRVGRQGLQPGARIRIGEYEILYGDEDDEIAAHPPLETMFVVGGTDTPGPQGQLAWRQRVLALDRPVFTVGSDKNANLRLRGFRIKPIQATIIREPRGGFRILATAGGRAVEVAGAPVQADGVLLEAGNEIRIGSHRIGFSVSS